MLGWTALTTETSTAAFSEAGNWFYPKLFVGPTGAVIELGNEGKIYSLDPSGSSAPTVLTKSLLPDFGKLPMAMFAPDQILAMRDDAAVQVVDVSGSTPVITNTAAIDQVRIWSNMTDLADGTVLVTGGSAEKNVLNQVDTTAQIWNPASGLWTPGASAAIPRLYHSVALLLPDATVVTGGGGNPGPLLNMNAEIYYPPYLYDPTGAPAVRPTITSATATTAVGTSLALTVQATDSVGAVTLVRAGAVTHSTNLEQRFFNLAFTQDGADVTATLPGNGNVLLPGTYMVFVFVDGVPSVASMVQITAS